MDRIWIMYAVWFVLGLCGGVLLGLLLFKTLRKHGMTDGELTLDLTGENTPVTLRLREFDTALEARRVTLDLEVLLPPEQQWSAGE